MPCVRRGWSFWLAACCLTAAAGCGSEEPAPDKPETIKLMMWDQDRLQGPIQARIPRFTARTGIKVDVKLVPALGDIFKTSQSPNHDVDVTIGLNVWVGDFVNSGFIEPLDRYIQADMNDPELSLGTIPPFIKKKNEWGGRIYSLICDNDNMILIYRKDVLGDPANQAAFAARYQYPLPNPPQTIDEVVDVATFFDGTDWDHDGVNERGFVISRTRDELMYWYALGLTTPYTVMPADVLASKQPALPRGLFLFKPDMSPLVTTPGFKLGIAQWLKLAKLATPTTGRPAVIDEIVQGKALMAIDWGDVGPRALAAMSEARGKLGFALSPGTHSYYDWVIGEMVKTPAVHFAPLHQANGFAFYMTSTSQHKDAVWKLIKYMNSPEVSMGIVSDSRGGYQPWRTTHMDVSKWVEAGWSPGDAANYVDAIFRSTDHENASLDVRIPGIFDYGRALENHLIRLLDAATPDIDAEMEACAADFNAVTTANQVEAQRKAYRAHLGLEE
jgi:multiple sugar transport system substrate-binding protein